MGQGHELSDALALEAVEFSSSISNAATGAETEVKALERELAAKGLFNSGARHLREMEIRFTKMAAGVIDQAISKRIELGRRIPELLTEPHLNTLREKLHHFVDAIVKGQETRIELGGSNAPGVAVSIRQLAERKAYAMKAGITQRLEALRLEARLGIHEREKPMTFNISHSTIAGLNVGTVVGDLTASVNVLNNQGQQDLAKTIQTLAEALAASTELAENRRKELLEHLSVVSAESALPPDNRKMGPLRSSIAVLREGTATAAQLAGLWTTAEQLLKTLGVLS